MPDHTPQYLRRLRIARVLSVVAAGLFVVSLVLPAYATYYGPSLGIESLVFGPLGVLGGHFSWFANPLIWLSWKKCYPLERAGSILFSTVAFGLACTFMVTDQIPQGSAGMYEYTIGSGYFVWLASIAFLLGAAAVLPSDVSTKSEDTMPDTSLERSRER